MSTPGSDYAPRPTGPDHTRSGPDHPDARPGGLSPQFTATTEDGKLAESVLKPAQWVTLTDRLGQIGNPEVAVKASKYAIKAGQTRASAAHVSE